ncbi:MAG: glycosyltransferase family 1 protein, partial [Verrucomicrobia bacterium]|nr:glycosyltransferase family 1 protein [Verrucomicrobiota bacterium]
GGIKLVGRGREQFVRFIDTSFSTVPVLERRSRLGRILKQATSLWIEIRRPKYELIVFRCFGRFIWRPDHSWMSNALRWLMRLFLRLCLLRRRTQAQLVVIDLVDEMTIDGLDLWLLEGCDLYFKRELSQNVWTTLQRVQPPHAEYNSLPTNPRFLRLADKFRPISIGITGAHLVELQEREPRKPDAVKKRYDLFFAGAVKHSTVRKAGLQWLERLQQQGYAVYLSTQRIEQQLFDELLSTSWLCWSPEGSGWDCYRHYEACLAGSVPVINFPTIQRLAPLIHGVHCFYYAVEGDDLFHVVRAALTDKYLLKEMAFAAREHVLAHHTCRRVGDYILAEAMSARSLTRSHDIPASPREPDLSYHVRSGEEVDL